MQKMCGWINELGGVKGRRACLDGQVTPRIIVVAAAKK